MAKIKGKWVFKEKISTTDFSYEYGSLGGTYEPCQFAVRGIDNIIFNSLVMVHEGSDGSNIALCFGKNYPASTDYNNGYIFWLEKWQYDERRYLDFGATPQEVSDEFVTWFTANATSDGGEIITEPTPTPTDAVTIEYNGAVIASLKAGQSATLPCKDKPMLTDVVVTVPEGMGAVEEWDGSYTVTDALELIEFSINGTAYQAESGMTWAEWVASDYNTGGYVEPAQSESIVTSSYNSFVESGGTAVKPKDVIVENVAYSTTLFGTND